MPDGTITITVVGAAGLIGRRHVQHILLESNAALHSLVDPTPGAKEMAEQAGVPLFATIDELFADATDSSHANQPRAAIIATPTGMHIPQACEMVRRGIHVLIEKPLSNTTHEAQPLIDAAKAPGAGTVLVGFHRRFNPYIVNLKNILSGQHQSIGPRPLGTVVAINALWCTRKPMTYFREAPWRSQRSAGGGVILTNLSHELDLMRYLFGDVSRVYAESGSSTRGFDVDETVAITLRFRSGVVATVLLSDAALSPYSFESATGENPNLAKHFQPVYTIMGTGGSINFPNSDYWTDKERNAEAGDWTLPLACSREASLPFDPSKYATDQGELAPFTKRLQHWIDVIQGREEQLSCTLEDGLRNMVILEAISTSASTCKPVDI